MARRFNTTGSCIHGEHCLLAPEERCPKVVDFIANGHFELEIVDYEIEIIPVG